MHPSWRKTLKQLTGSLRNLVQSGRRGPSNPTSNPFSWRKLKLGSQNSMKQQLQRNKYLEQQPLLIRIKNLCLNSGHVVRSSLIFVSFFTVCNTPCLLNPTDFNNTDKSWKMYLS